MKAPDAVDGQRTGPLGGASGAASGRGRRPLVFGAVLTASALVLATWQAGLSLPRGWPALIVVGFLGLVGAVAWPVFATLAVRGQLLPALLLAFAGHAILLALMSRGLSGFDVHGPAAGVFASVVLALVTLAASLVLAASDTALYDRAAIRRQARYGRPRRGGAPAGQPGLVFVEINGLPEPVLRDAVAGGHVPTMARWLRTGRHRLVSWECDLSSQISAGQAGILYGNNFNVPAFRWYDKTSRSIVVSNQVESGAATIEREVANGPGLLAGAGASRSTLFSGDAADSLFTCSLVGANDGNAQTRVFSDLDVAGWTRLLLLVAGDRVAEVGRTMRGWRVQRERPARRRGGWSVGHLFMAVVLRELSTQSVIGDMVRGVPAIYVSFAGYDAAAHEGGVRGGEALRALSAIDRQLARLNEARRAVAHPYELVVFSSHGQSEGTSFRGRYGQTLAQLVHDLIPNATVLVQRAEAEEAEETAASLLSEITATDTWYGGLLRRALLWRPEAAGAVAPVPRADAQPPGNGKSTGAREALVLASGSLGLISFPAWSHRLTYEEITSRFPPLLPGLVDHAGIAFVLVNSAEHGALVVGRSGTTYLDDDRVEGECPLTAFGPHVARHLRRQNLFTNAPDIFVHSRYDSQTGEVAPFEEVVGSHGGLGGGQSQPFLLHPTPLPLDGAPPVGAAEVHALFTRWKRELAGTRRPEASVESRR